MGGPNNLSDRNPAKTDVFTNSCSEPFFEGAEILVFLPLIFNSIERIHSDQPLIELTVSQELHFQVLEIFPCTNGG